VRAAVCRSYGPPEGVRVERFPAPPLAAGQVRVRVHAASVNYPDVLLVANTYQISVPTPFVPGSEFAGIVEEVDDPAGRVAGQFAPGDRVSGTALVGAFAEEVVVAARAVTRLPSTVDLRAAAAFGVAHRTAYHALRSFARVGPGEDLVVLGAGGGVGLAAVQMGVLLGATVTAVASSDEKLKVAASYGARHLVNHRQVKLREALAGGADAVVDPVGGELSEPALRALRWGGRFVTVGYASGAIPRVPLNLVLLKGVRVLGFQLRDFATKAADEYRRNEEDLAGLLATGQVRPHIGAVFPIDEVAAALRLVADGQAIGKVVIDVHQ